MLLTLVEEFCIADQHPFDATAIETALIELLTNPVMGSVWLISNDQHILGYALLTLGFSLEYRGKDAFVDELYIRPAYRRQGIGTKTLKFLETFCRNLGVRALHLEVEKGNHEAQTLYRKAGYEDQGRILLNKRID
ncbi:GNAT family N-acetyltransferase [Gloeobacter morelensis]|uniref:GNAT family N-acetyltransferase n=1 Tax=Gloeobacter morelensis MG652769 TaxID=2781736 RepID=A0ABY3PGW4_9CYAN|nr:GNAT family N-acetyltransferase [Gloeobacter morelensis]UFP92917.1 GNAT family N-acetyltransferase [Gloeobacter morelensis MG652769]